MIASKAYLYQAQAEHCNVSSEKNCPQNRMVLDIFTASKEGTCAIIQAEFCVFIPYESANVISLLNHMIPRVNALSDLTSSPGDLINQ